MNELIKNKWALVVFAGIGILITILIIKLQPVMQHDPQARAKVAVSVVKIEQQTLRPTIIGYGSVESDLTLQAKAEVRGRVIYLHSELKKGAFLAKDTLVLKIDDKDYLLALKQAEADLLTTQANLKEKQLTIENTVLDLKLAEEKYKVREQEYSRLLQLKKSGAVSQSKLDGERQNLLQQQQEVQQLQNKQTTLPSEIAVLKAKIAISEAKLEQSLRDLARTEIKLPFNARVRKVDAEQDQYVAQGALLFDVSGMDKVVINAQFPVEQFSQITKGFDKQKIDFANIGDQLKMSEMFDSLGLTATVTIAGGDYAAWTAKVERISDSIDPQSRTIGVLVSVSDSYQNIDPGVRPPLLEGNYMQVSLSGAPQEFFVLPRFALQQKQIYSVTDDNRLKRITLGQVQLQGELALAKPEVAKQSGLVANQLMITSDLFPAVNGMQLKPEINQQQQNQLKLWLEAAQ